jgi:Fic family protein
LSFEPPLSVAARDYLMDLPSVSEIRVDEVTTAMLKDLDDLAHQVNEIRPLDPEVVRQVKEELLGERVFSSNAIEGNTLSIRETRLVLQTKTYLDVRRKREAQEALNLGAAANLIEQFLQTDEAWHDLDKLLLVHEVLMRGVVDQIAGVLRNRDVMIRGAKLQPPGAHLVSNLMEQFIDCIRRDVGSAHGLVLAAWAHWAIARIHPFEDGNGRLARLWQDLLLLRAHYTVAIIRPQDRDTYLDALTRADENDFNPLVQLICQRVMSTLQVYLNAQESADALKGWAEELVGESSTREIERRKLAYERWRLTVEQLRDAFERCASLINRGGDRTLEVQLQDYDVIDQVTWETLSSGGSAKKTWFFKVLFRKHQEVIWYFFYFGRHHWHDAEAAIEDEGPFVAILISEQRPGDDLAIRLDEIENTPISVRELLVLGREVVRRRWDFEASRMVYDRPVKPIDAAKDFFADVVLKVLA